MTYPQWREAFASAMDERLHTIEYLDRLVSAGHAQVWYGEKSAIVTEVRAYPTGALVIEGLVAAGDLTEIVETLIPRAETWGKEGGCIMARIESRAGWGRKLKSKGWEISQTALVKTL